MPGACTSKLVTIELEWPLPRDSSSRKTKEIDFLGPQPGGELTNEAKSIPACRKPGVEVERWSTRNSRTTPEVTSVRSSVLPSPGFGLLGQEMDLHLQCRTAHADQ